MEIGGYYQISDSLHIYENDCLELDSRIHRITLRNKDNLSIDKGTYDQVFECLWKKMSALSKKELTVEEFYQLLKIENIPEGYRNLLLTVAADSARRRGYFKEMSWAIAECTNSLLVLLTETWVERLQR